MLSFFHLAKRRNIWGSVNYGLKEGSCRTSILFGEKGGKKEGRGENGSKKRNLKSFSFYLRRGRDLYKEGSPAYTVISMGDRGLIGR